MSASQSQANRPVPEDAVLRALTGWIDDPHGSLAQKLANRFRQAIRSGLLPGGTRLPPERLLAGQLAVSRSTVTTALDALRGDGLIESVQGRGSTVVGRHHDPVGGRVASFLVHVANTIDLATGNPPDPSHLPPMSFDVADLVAFDAGPGVALAGIPSLRSAIAARYTDSGWHTRPDEIHVVAGAHQAIGAVVATEVGRGGRLGVEAVNYPGVFDIAEHTGATIVALERDDRGLRVDSVARAADGLDALYLQSGAHNPTGVVLAERRRAEIARLADRYDVTVIDDHTLAALRFDGNEHEPMGRRCRRATVITIGSMSKVCWAGLRVGWIRASVDVIERTTRHLMTTDLGVSVPSQLVTERLLPLYDDLAGQRRRTLADGIDLLTELVTARLPGWEFRRPEGGSALWIRLPVDDAGPFVQRARRHGVLIAPGSISTPQGTSPFVRICADRPRELIEAGVDRLTRAWSEHES